VPSVLTVWVLTGMSKRGIEHLLAAVEHSSDTESGSDGTDSTGSLREFIRDDNSSITEHDSSCDEGAPCRPRRYRRLRRRREWSESPRESSDEEDGSQELEPTVLFPEDVPEVVDLTETTDEEK